MRIRPPAREQEYRRLARRNLESLLRHKFLNEYGYDKGQVIVEAIVADICELIRVYYRRVADLEPGELVYPAPAIDERAGQGKAMAQTRLVPVKLTVVADEDLAALRAGLTASERRVIRLRRLAIQAHQQGALLSQADLGLLMGVSSDSVGRLVRQLRTEGEFLPLRGYIADMGRFPTHKALIVRLYLEGMLTPDIARRTYHTKGSVDRYIRDFDKIRLLAQRFTPPELPTLTGLSEGLISEYLTLAQEFGLHTQPHHPQHAAIP